MGYVRKTQERARARNFVAKHAKINRAATHVDRKKASKRGAIKHKGNKHAMQKL